MDSLTCYDDKQRFHMSLMSRSESQKPRRPTPTLTFEVRPSLSANAPSPRAFGLMTTLMDWNDATRRTKSHQYHLPCAGTQRACALSFTDLPLDILRVITEQLDIEALVALMKTCKSMASITDQKFLTSLVTKQLKAYLAPRKLFNPSTCLSIMTLSGFEAAKFRESTRIAIVAASEVHVETLRTILQTCESWEKCFFRFFLLALWPFKPLFYRYLDHFMDLPAVRSLLDSDKEDIYKRAGRLYRAAKTQGRVDEGSMKAIVPSYSKQERRLSETSSSANNHDSKDLCYLELRAGVPISFPQQPIWDSLTAVLLKVQACQIQMMQARESHKLQWCFDCEFDSFMNIASWLQWLTVLEVFWLENKLWNLRREEFWGNSFV